MRLTPLLCIVFSLSLVSCSRLQTYYVNNAQIASNLEGEKGTFTENRPESTKLLLNGHYVKSGNNLVLLFRRYTTGSIFVIDDEGYEKLTIEIRNYILGKPIRFDSSDIKFYYSSGSSGFVSKGHGVYSTSGSGSLTIRKVERDKITAEIDLTMWARPAGAFPFEGKQVQIRKWVSFEEKNIAELTPWLGIPDSSLGKEVYP